MRVEPATFQGPVVPVVRVTPGSPASSRSTVSSSVEKTPGMSQAYKAALGAAIDAVTVVATWAIGGLPLNRR
jgi:hypothetical protein